MDLAEVKAVVLPLFPAIIVPMLSLYTQRFVPIVLILKPDKCYSLYTGNEARYQGAVLRAG